MPDISRSKGNQTIKFGQSIEFNTSNTFVEKSYTRCGRETIPKHFSNKLKLSLSLYQLFYSFIQFVFTVRSDKCYWNIVKPSHRPLTFILPYFFKKQRLELVSLPHFLRDFWSKIIFLLYFINWPMSNFHHRVAFNSGDIGQYMHCNC